jgi:predicted O-linked N-acetylglucosamine transferase (SPINDLY family)
MSTFQTTPSLLTALDAIRQAESHLSRGDRTTAIALYRDWLKQPDQSNQHLVFFSLAVLLAFDGCLAEAECMFRHVLHLAPDLFLAHFNLGLLLERQGRIEEAIRQWQSALNRPAIQEARNVEHIVQINTSLGRLLETLRRYDKAEEALGRSLQLDINQSSVIYHWVHLRQKQCKWPTFDGLGRSLDGTLRASASALAMLSETDDPAEQLAAALHFTEQNIQLKPRRVPAHHRYRHERIRIGYLSSNFCMHAVSFLTVELFETHDRSRFEVYGFCFSAPDHSPHMQRVIQAFDHYHPVGHLTDEQIADFIQAQEIDILFDLQGLTSGARPHVVAMGAAPIQIAYLGFPGPSGLPYVDYVVADPFIFPEELKPHFTEKPLYLKTLFQVSDSKRFPSSGKNRADFGVPEDQFLFCAFNNNFKITPEVFETWMRILRRTPDTLLWLLSDNEWAEDNLRQAARAHGISPERLIFASRVSPPDYLARFGVADVFLDTFPYNAGTTATDALWSGLPILTYAGRTYVSRMAGSLLRSAGLDDFITNSLSDYEERAVLLANRPELLRQARLSLQRQRQSGELFDTRRFTRELEAALTGLIRNT